MSKNLIIVESPNKIHTIGEFVGDDYQILATVGHIRELNKKYGFNKETFDPNWTTVVDKKGKSKSTIINKIKEVANKAETIYLATDPDREGEAISWHVWDILSEKDKSKCKRITFNEITKSAVLNAINNSRKIDMNLVSSQFARRIIDRMIGYDLSMLIKNKLKEKSAGRVQSVALLFLVNRQLERDAFVKSFWWEIESFLKINNEMLSLKKTPYQIEEYKGETKGTNFRFAKKEDAEIAISKLSNYFKVTDIGDSKLSKLEPYKSITTDKLLQLASINLGWKPKKTTIIAQELFEGLEFDGKYQALISYPRTDSERLSDEFIKSTFEFIEKTYGEKYVGEFATNNKKKNNDKNIQDAHEAIRPIDVSIIPSNLKNKISKDCYELYNLIWTRTMCVLMSSPLINRYHIVFDNNGFIFDFTHKQLIFDGYYILPEFKKTKDEISLEKPIFLLNKEYEKESIDVKEHQKNPPPYFTEASLIVALKDAGVGRPSTYSQMASIGVERGYVTIDKRSLIPNEHGMKVIQSLKTAFPDIITPQFTADMENNLDKIANGDEQWKDYLYKFAPNFKNEMNLAKQNMEKVPDELVGKKCTECGSELVYKMSRYQTKFIGCSNYPKCRYIEKVEKTIEKINENCPECGKELVIRHSKKGNPFIGCSNFPKCRYLRTIDKNKS